MKQLVDAEPTPGRFLLTGSTNFLAVPTISESLAGRVQIFHLGPLSEAELAGVAPTAAGQLLETFTVNEIARQVSGSTRDCTLSHYRDNQGHEVDLVLEDPGGAVVAVEVKATQSPDPRQLRPLAWLRDRLDNVAPDTYRARVLLHTGSQSGKLGDRLHLHPIDSLWSV